MKTYHFMKTFLLMFAGVATFTLLFTFNANAQTSCTAPSLIAMANGVSITTTECSGTSITLTANPSGGSSCTGNWEYAWSDGTNYWNGTAFASSTALWNVAYSTITLPTVTATKTYTGKVECSTDASCSNQSNVIVTIIGASASCTAAIGSPANGAAHHLSISWTAVTGADGYELEYSTNGSTWVSLYTGTALTYDHNCADNPNAPFYYKVKAYKGIINCTYTNCTQYPIYTACDVPALPAISNPGSSTLGLTLVAETPVANSAITTYSIYCPTTSQYVQANGTMGATEVFQTKATWGTITVNGLTATTQYCFYAKAKNFDGDVRTPAVSALLAAEPFTTSSNFSTGTSTTTKFWSPSSCTNGGLLYYSSGGCTGGYIGKTGSWTNYFGCFVRTPQVNCTGNTSVTMNFDLSNSYIASHIVTSPSNSDAVRFYLWDNGSSSYYNATSIKINGTEVSSIDGNGTWLKFSQVRSCENVTVTFSLSSVTNLSNVLFYLEPDNPYNDSYTYSVVFDNISMGGAISTVCGTTTVATGLSAYDNDMKVTIAPNPLNEQTTVSFEREIKSFDIFDITGKIVRTYDDIDGNKLVISKDKLAEGLFFYKITEKNGGIHSGKLMIQ